MNSHNMVHTVVVRLQVTVLNLTTVYIESHQMTGKCEYSSGLRTLTF